MKSPAMYLYLMIVMQLMSCRMDSDYDVQQVRYSDKTELYGVWNIQKRDYLGIGYEPSDAYYVWGGPDSSYYINGSFWEDPEKTNYFFVGKNDWSLEQGHVIQLSEAWENLIYHIERAEQFYQGWPECIKDEDTSYCIWTVSDVDSLKDAIHLFNKSHPYYAATAPSRYAITQDRINGHSTRSLYLVDDECFQDNPGVENVQDNCYLSEFVKVEIPNQGKILQHVQVLSSSELWRALEKYSKQ